MPHDRAYKARNSRSVTFLSSAFATSSNFLRKLLVFDDGVFLARDYRLKLLLGLYVNGVAFRIKPYSSIAPLTSLLSMAPKTLSSNILSYWTSASGVSFCLSSSVLMRVRAVLRSSPLVNADEISGAANRTSVALSISTWSRAYSARSLGSTRRVEIVFFRVA